ncbi:nucleoside diphosphate kinase regulator [Afifella aestuarii]|uniref:nucleoside diphosphate kinase regulator n=1 Tax=Afifella aestuarii TaxID=1909496 RepID=UPI000FE30592|nr:nucleoside diphosphate kinase regulator [Afifella aestuarii]
MSQIAEKTQIVQKPVVQKSGVRKPKALPRLVIGSEDHARLYAIANSLGGPLAELGEKLLSELDRARIVPQEKVPAKTVRMGSTVSFATSDGFERTYKLVYPEEADVAQARISVLTPIGAALIGLSEGQTIPWEARDGRALSLTVLNLADEG